MKQLIIGSNCDSTANYYKKLNIDSSVLVLDPMQDYTVGHTSIQDISEYTTLEAVLNRADEIFWAECDSSEFNNIESYIDFIFWLKDYNRLHKTVKNINLVAIDPYHMKVSYKPTVDQVVFYGCSFTAGYGLTDQTTQYANLLGQQLNKSVLNLSECGASNDLIFNKFVNTQWNQGQTAVVQLTNPYRLYYCDDDYKKYNVLLSNSIDNQTLHRSLVEVYQRPWVFSQLLDKINAIDQIAQCNQLKLALWLFDYKHPEIYSQQDQSYLYHIKSFVPASIMQNYLVDFANDNLHPGVKSNKIISDVLYNFISEVY